MYLLQDSTFPNVNNLPNHSVIIKTRKCHFYNTIKLQSLFKFHKIFPNGIFHFWKSVYMSHGIYMFCHLSLFQSVTIPHSFPFRTMTLQMSTDSHFSECLISNFKKNSFKNKFTNISVIIFLFLKKIDDIYITKRTQILSTELSEYSETEYTYETSM